MFDTVPMRPSDLPSGRFVLRLDPRLHARLRDEAGRLDISMNEYCSRVLAAPGSAALLPAPDVVLRAIDQFPDRLVGVIAHGSWARDELADSSDIDLLIVLSGDVPLNRDLYRDWDRDPIRWDSRTVEVHFVHLPSEGDPISGSWAEVALEGIVLLDHDLLIRRRLVEIRRRIAAGEVVRRMAGSQPYWVGVA
jgi:predicted nucleotidyltransferase